MTHAARRLEKDMEGTQKAMNAKARMRKYVEKKMDEDEQARKREKGVKRRRRKAKLSVTRRTRWATK